jgi:hypothetical protein
MYTIDLKAPWGHIAIIAIGMTATSHIPSCVHWPQAGPGVVLK